MNRKKVFATAILIVFSLSFHGTALAGFMDSVKNFMLVKRGEIKLSSRSSAFNAGTESEPIFVIMDKVADSQGMPNGLEDEILLSLDEIGPEIRWRATPWTGCSVPCGSEGTRTHSWACTDRAGNEYDTCLAEDLPEEVTKTCNNPCPTSCSGIFAMLPEAEDGNYFLQTPEGLKEFFCSKENADWKRLPGSPDNYAYIASTSPSRIKPCSGGDEWSPEDVSKFNKIGHGWKGLYNTKSATYGYGSVSSFDRSYYWNFASHISHLSDADFRVSYYPRVGQYSYEDELWWEIYRYNFVTGKSTLVKAAYLYNGGCAGCWDGTWRGNTSTLYSSESIAAGETGFRLRVRGVRRSGTNCDSAAKFLITFFNEIPRTCLYFM